MLCRHYPQNCGAVFECDVMALIGLFQARGHSAALTSCSRR
jgi:hypothetical protein